MPEPLKTSFRSRRRLSSVYWLFLSLLILLADYATGPFVQFPILFLIPVTLAAWYSGLKWALGLSLGLTLARVFILAGADIPWTLTVIIINEVILLTVLCLFAFLVDRTAQRSELLREIRVLRGMLPICMFCKRIRREEGDWEALESYISRRSEAQFSHGLCPDCRKRHYGGA